VEPESRRWLSIRQCPAVAEHLRDRHQRTDAPAWSVAKPWTGCISSGDAENLSSYFNDSFDAIFYTASIFLLPGVAESLRQACGLLLPGGVVSISYYAGLFDESGNDAIRKAFPEQKYQYGAVPIADLMSCLESLPGTRTTRIEYRFEVNGEFLFDFLSIPAQSSGLFPKIPYLERIPKIRDFCDLLTRRVEPVFMGWEFLIARKR
jgi:cyclopropane-fatty-acyl-phospholipid synthase